MAYKPKWPYAIPVVANLAVLAVIPTILDKQTASNATVLIIAALAFPWFMGLLVGKLIQGIIDEVAKRRDADEKSDFV